MASWVVRLPPEGAVWVRVLARDILLCTALRKNDIVNFAVFLTLYSNGACLYPGV